MAAGAPNYCRTILPACPHFLHGGVPIIWPRTLLARTMCTPSTGSAPSPSEASPVHSEPPVAPPPAPTPTHVSSSSPIAACSVHAWLPTFRRHVLRSELLHLPPDFLQYLAADGVFVDPSSGALPKRGLTDAGDADSYHDWSDTASSSESESEQDKDDAALGPASAAGLSLGPDTLQPGSSRNHHHRRGCSSGGSSSSSSSEGGRAAADPRPWTVRFPQLQQEIEDCVQRLGGAVVPKLNWSCPSDATWINPSTTLACSNAAQVVLMLKSSDRIGHDIEQLQQPQDQSPSSSPPPAPLPAPPLPPVLLLRKWFPGLRAEREFRCFVRRRHLVGACQRDISQHFPQLYCPSSPAPEGPAPGPSAPGQEDPSASEPHSTMLTAIKQAMSTFHTSHVAPHFPLDQYTLDVYVTLDLSVRLLDFNPVGGSTSPLLFTWEELGMLPETEEGGAPGRQAELGPGSSAGEEGAAGGAVAGGGWPLRLVPAGAGMQAGQRAACGMPLDMLSLQEGGLQNMMEAMQRAGTNNTP